MEQVLPLFDLSVHLICELVVLEITFIDKCLLSF